MFDAVSPADPAAGKKAEAKCCTNDITLEEFRRLKGKMDASNPNATTVEEYLGGAPGWRTELYAANGTLMTHKESIDLFKSLGVKFTPELKGPSVEMPFEGDYEQEAYTQQMIDEYKEAGIDPGDVCAQSCDLGDVLYWIENEPEFGAQAVYLDDRYETLEGFEYTKPETWKPTMQELADKGVKIIAPPMWMLVANEDGTIVPSVYAKQAKEAGLDIIIWTLERSGTLTDGGGWYYQSISDVVDNSGDTYALLDVLAKDVGVLGVFSDWPATVSYYASCMKLN